MSNLLALDVGEKRIGVAYASSETPIAISLTTINVDGTEIKKILDIINDKNVGVVVVGYPRNQSGEPTAQTTIIESFAKRLREYVEVIFQDESLTSVMAEDNLRLSGRPYEKADIDALAARIILQDYLEENYAAGK